MTRKEAERINQQESALLELGFTTAEAEQLRRISMTLHSWYERQCNGEIERAGEDGDGKPYVSYAAWGGKHLAYPIPDRERSAERRLLGIMKRVNHDRPLDTALDFYLQDDPRGASLYILRPGDVPSGKHADSYYNRGLCIY